MHNFQKYVYLQLIVKFIEDHIKLHIETNKNAHNTSMFRSNTPNTYLAKYQPPIKQKDLNTNQTTNKTLL